MALFGPLAVIRARCDRWPEFRAAFAYAADALTPGSSARLRLESLEEGATNRVELPAGAYAIEMAYRTKARAEGFLETHRRFIDVQVVVAGEEFMDVAAAPGLGTVRAYNPDRDFAELEASPAASALRIRAGEVAVFWPEDAHQPTIAAGAPALVRKTVIKVPVPA